MEPIRKSDLYSPYSEGHAPYPYPDGHALNLHPDGHTPHLRRVESFHSAVPPRIGPYRILEKLGEGGMGMVYKARHERLHRYAAIKLLLPHLRTNPAARARFEQEARAAAAVEHPNVTTVLEVGTTEPTPWDPDGQPYIAMPYYAGETIHQKLARGPFTVSDALDYACQTAAGLDAAHRRGIYHRDVKPANLIVTEEGVVKIVDFGLARTAGVTMTAAGTALGSAAYMSPEQTRGANVDHRTDIWSMGVVLYEMLTATRPFAGDIEPAVVYSILHTDPIPVRSLRPDVPVNLERIVIRCMAKDPSARYPSMAALLADLIQLTYSDAGRS